VTLPSAKILTIEEYKRLLSIMELRWPPDEDFERRRIARLMVVIGFRAGLRTEECRLLRVNDLILRGRKQLWVRPSKGHTLKSDHSLRRIEIWKLLSKEELEELERWITGRGLSGCDFLFKTSALDVVPPSIFETINGFMREVIGGSSVGGHFHHCRHSVASHWAIELLIGEGSDIQKLLTSEASTAYPRTAVRCTRIRFGSGKTFSSLHAYWDIATQQRPFGTSTFLDFCCATSSADQP